MNRAALEGGSPDDGSPPGVDWIALEEAYQFRRGPVVGCDAKYLAVKPQDDSTLSAAQSRRILHEGF